MPVVRDSFLSPDAVRQNLQPLNCNGTTQSQLKSHPGLWLCPSVTGNLLLQRKTKLFIVMNITTLSWDNIYNWESLDDCLRNLGITINHPFEMIHSPLQLV
jgi:hypothetical protein